MKKATAKRSNGRTVEAISPGQLASVGVSPEVLAAIYTVNSVKGLGPQVFKRVFTAGISLPQLCAQPELLPVEGKRGQSLRKKLHKINEQTWTIAKERAQKHVESAAKYQASILTYSHPFYPRNVFESNYPVPVLFARGALPILQRREVIACVGTRGIRPPYSEWEMMFAKTACHSGYVIVSGFALGADTIGHRTALNEGADTICVLPGGLDRPFPPENKVLWDKLLNSDKAVMISEAPFGARASSLTLRKRNKLIVACALGVLVAQSSAKGGAMNAFRFASEARKPVSTFPSDGTDETSGHEMIRLYVSGAVLSNAEEHETWLRKLSSLTLTEQSGTATHGTQISFPQ